jgi:hypothetical protein
VSRKSTFGGRSCAAFLTGKSPVDRHSKRRASPAAEKDAVALVGQFEELNPFSRF